MKKFSKSICTTSENDSSFLVIEKDWKSEEKYVYLWKIGEKLSGAGQGVAQQVKNFADVARLNSIISEKEKQIAQLYIEIGQAYYEHHKIDPQGEEIERIQK